MSDHEASNNEPPFSSPVFEYLGSRLLDYHHEMSLDWIKGGGNPLAFRDLVGLADHYVGNAISLTRPAQARSCLSQMRAAIQALPTPGERLRRRNLVEEIVAYQIGRFLVSLGHRATRRMLELPSLGKDVVLSPRGTSALYRVGSCYLLGFDMGCVISARSTLEFEARARVPGDLCVDVLGERERGRGFSLADVLGVARRMKILPPCLYDAALEVKRRADRIIHVDPESEPDASHLIQQTLCVVEELGATR